MGEFYKPNEGFGIEQSVSFGIFGSDPHFPMTFSPILSPFYNRQMQQQQFAQHSVLKSPQGLFGNGLMTFPQTPLHGDSEQKCFDDLPLGSMFEQQPKGTIGSPGNHVIAVKRSAHQTRGFKMEQVRFQQSPNMRFQTPQYQQKIEPPIHKQFMSDKVYEKSRRLNFDQVPKKLSRKFSDDDALKGRSQKGRLRYLSLKVKDIVCDLRETSYKQVAQKLIEQFQQPQMRMAECTPKDEQNIKRRVYDALNVMIASGVLRKENKKVLSDNAFRGKSKSDYRRGELQALHEDMQRTRERADTKRQRLSDLFDKVANMQNLIHRNERELNSVQEKIYFPLLTFQEDIGKVRFELKGETLQIISQRVLTLNSDLDVLLGMNQHSLQEIRERHPLYKQLQPFISTEDAEHNSNSSQF